MSGYTVNLEGFFLAKYLMLIGVLISVVCFIAFCIIILIGKEIEDSKWKGFASFFLLMTVLFAPIVLGTVQNVKTHELEEKIVFSDLVLTDSTIDEITTAVSKNGNEVIEGQGFNAENEPVNVLIAVYENEMRVVEITGKE